MQIFEAVLIRPTGTGTWTYLNIPFQAQDAFGSRGQVQVKGTLNGVPYQSTLMPHGDGTHYMVVGKPLREAIQRTVGDTVEVTMELDTEKREIQAPQDLLDALANHAIAQAAYQKLAYSHRKEYVAWIDSAKKPETRQRRINQAIEKIAAGQKLKSNT